MHIIMRMNSSQQVILFAEALGTRIAIYLRQVDPVCKTHKRQLNLRFCR